MERMVEIMSGECKKCPKNDKNKAKIVCEFAKHVGIVNSILINIDLFSTENK